jgi:hypothetical protein
MYCETCHRVERDPNMLDTETCSQCGGYLAGMDDEPDEDDESDLDLLREDRDERERADRFFLPSEASHD